MEILTSLPQTAFGWIGFLLAAIAAGFSAYLIYNRNKAGADDRLIGILQDTVAALEAKVDVQGREIDHLTDRLNEVMTANKTLTEALQGRDQATLAFQKELLQAATTAKETNDIAQNLEKALSKLTDLLSAHMVAMETHTAKTERPRTKNV